MKSETFVTQEYNDLKHEENENSSSATLLNYGKSRISSLFTNLFQKSVSIPADNCDTIVTEDQDLNTKSEDFISKNENKEQKYTRNFNNYKSTKMNNLF